MHFQLSSPVAAGSDPAPPGTVTFYDNFVPSLKAGQYALSVAQHLTGEKLPKDLGIPVLQQDFLVKGPRFTLDPADLHRVFPVNLATGRFADCLPMVVFNKRALPWERPLSLQGLPNLELPDATQYPWLALLVSTPAELGLPADGSQQNRTGSQSVLLQDAVGHSQAGMLKPDIKPEAGEDFATTHCTVIDVPVATFTSLMPSLDDARYLTHVRHVATDAKTPQNMVHDGWFSNVVANRPVTAPASGADAAQRNIAHLVSLEGYETYLSHQKSLPPTVTTVRLISLHSWSFDCQHSPDENFAQLMDHLVADPGQQGAGLLLHLPLPAPAPANPVAAPAAPAEVTAQVATRLRDGYVPLGYATWGGDQTFAWYRGPLSPVRTTTFLADRHAPAPAPALVPTTSPDAMIYDPGTGLFDQSYAVAFQTGRSLALASKPFSTNLLQWRRMAHGQVDLLLERLHSPTRRPQFLRVANSVANSTGGLLPTTSAADLAALLAYNPVAAAFRQLLTTDFHEALAVKVGKGRNLAPADDTPALATLPAPGPVVADLQQLLQHPAVPTLLAHLSGLEALGTLATPLTPGQGSLTLAQGLPEALSPGTTLTVTSPDGTAQAELQVGQAVAVGATAVPVQPYAGPATLPAHSPVQLGGRQLLADQLVRWLTQTAQLHGVPFNNLVADARMLPQESIRFFYLDENWVAALLDGALSIGLQSSRDGALQQAMREKLHRAAGDRLGEVRDARRGSVSGGVPPTAGTKTGLLLRSLAVSAWPGLEIRGWGKDAAQQEVLLKPLRLERVAPDILLAVFPDFLCRVDLREPGEGLTLGFEEADHDASSSQVTLRYVPGATAGDGSKQVGILLPGKTIPDAALKQARRPAPASAVNPATNPVYTVAGAGGLVGLCSHGLFGNTTSLTPASFAVQLVRVPEHLEFTPPSAF